MILVIDNYDSFAFNLARYLRRLGRETVVVRNTEIDAGRVRAMRPDVVVLSPGPCTPREAGCSLEVVRRLHEEIPMLGICLGHQVIAMALGGRIVPADEPIHGRSTRIRHDGRGIFTGLPGEFTAGRYHSLVVEEATLPECLEVAARAEDGSVMAIRHRRLTVVGLQFHPESILTEHGYPLLGAFLRQAGLGVASPLPTLSDEYTGF